MVGRCWGIFLLAAVVAFIVYISSSPSARTFSISSLYRDTDFLQNVTYLTAKSPKTPYLDIERNVYNPLGFETIRLSKPFAILKHKESLNCETVFTEWEAVAVKHDPKLKPPEVIPENLYLAYTMNGYAYVGKYYLNDKYDTNKSAVWERKNIEAEVARRSLSSNYPGEGEAVFYALKWYGISGQSGVVVGSQSPWVETMCLENNASKVLTVEYQNILMDHPQMSYINPMELVKNWTEHHEKYDFVVSFSSIEHSGLGRYGDPIDPIGDIREMQKMLCLLKRGGLMFLGFPVGFDGIAYNAHRFYGRIRLPMMFAGFELLNIFHGKNEMPVKLTEEYLSGKNGLQYLFVLRKL